MGQVQRIAILGGGMGALSTAYLLTERPGWQNEYVVTVFQPGWRLGGKGASGRNLTLHGRIEEHGLHVWHGFYENAFALLRRCYAELGRPANAPLSTWEQAFTPIHHTAVQERLGDQWLTWPLFAPPHPGTPGDGTRLPGWLQTVSNLTEFVLATVRQLPRGSGRVEMLLEAAEEMLEQVLRLVQEAFHHGQRPGWEEELLAHVDQCIRWLQSVAGEAAQHDDELRRLFVVLELAGTITRGVLVDEVFRRGFSALDDENLTAWLERHGASPLTISSALVRGIYQAAFAYPGGDTSQPGQLAAGTALRGFLRFLNYKGAPLYRMNAGMGDAVFAPLYEVLRRRGVRFRFFHRVTGLHLTPDGQNICRVDLVKEATLKNPDKEYEPLVHVKGLPCWPSAPLSDQLRDTEPVGQSLHVGQDFDTVVLGIPIGALPSICGELIEQSPAWRKMVDRVTTVATQAMQIWMHPDLEHLGWVIPARLVGTYAEPFDTWMEMSHLLEREDWADASPGSLAYLCGPMPEPSTPDDASEQVLQAATRWLEENAAHLWPRTVGPGGLGFDWQTLVDDGERKGAARLAGQYWRANTDPSERYVLSVPGTTSARLRADESGFANLFLAGDWLRTGLDVGCIEAAVMAGMQASRAICGYPSTVVGESDLP